MLREEEAQMHTMAHGYMCLEKAKRSLRASLASPSQVELKQLAVYSYLTECSTSGMMVQTPEQI